MTAILALFALSSLGFWLLCSLTAVLIIWSLELTESTGWPTATLLGFIGIIAWVPGVNIHWVIDHPWLFGIGLVLYVLAGLGWAFFKWYWYLLTVKKGNDDRRIEYAKTYGVTGVGAFIEIPVASDHKAGIISWMTYWPFSAFWFLIHKPILRTFTWVFDHFSNSFDRMSQKIMASQVKND